MRIQVTCFQLLKLLLADNAALKCGGRDVKSWRKLAEIVKVAAVKLADDLSGSWVENLAIAEQNHALDCFRVEQFEEVMIIDVLLECDLGLRQIFHVLKLIFTSEY